jgi:ATP-dependent RNA helicase DeaD
MISFKETGLKPEIVEAISELGFQNATPIQEECIPFILSSRDDLIANAQTGTGKTAAFGLPIIEQIDLDSKNVQAIVIAPTRELAIQISKDLQHYASKIPALKIIPVYGGASIEPQLKALKSNVHIVVGTPGRLLDLINRKKLKLNEIKWLVLDEADEMLNMGFKDELDGILSTTPESRQTLLFSATLPKEIIRISKNYMKNPQQIAVAKANVGADTVEHHYYQVNARDKYAVLKRLADLNPNIYAIVFCRTRRETKDIADKLIKDNYNADALHGDLSQAQREHVMNRFRVGNLQILVATDVAARGLDVNDLTHVINYSLPDDPEVYVHRSGRTGRAGKNGISISITHNRENRKIREIEKLIGKSFDKKLVPNGREICEIQLLNLVSNMENVDINSGEIDSFMDAIYAQLENMSKEEIIKRFISIEFNRFLDYYKGAKDLNISSSEARHRDRDRDDRMSRNDRSGRRERKERGSRSSNSKFKRLHINIGSKNSANPGSIIGLVNKATPGLSVDIGDIEILKKFSFFEVDVKHVDKVLENVNGMSYHDEIVTVEVSDSPKPVKKEAHRGQAPRGGRRDGKFGGKSKGGNYKGGKRKESSKERRAKKQW